MLQLIVIKTCGRTSPESFDVKNMLLLVHENCLFEEMKLDSNFLEETFAL